jgi:hypothetical protein
VNDLYARKVAYQYFLSSGEIGEQKGLSWLDDIYDENITLNPNTLLCIHTVNEIAIRISKSQGMSVDKVVESFFHSSYNGLALTDKITVKELDLDGVFGRGFTKKLLGLNYNDVRPCMEFLDTYGLTENKNAFTKALKYKVAKILNLERK